MTEQRACFPLVFLGGRRQGGVQEGSRGAGRGKQVREQVASRKGRVIRFWGGSEHEAAEANDMKHELCVPRTLKQVVSLRYIVRCLDLITGRDR
jgi:hypothetical protein